MQRSQEETTSNVEYSSSVHTVKCGVPEIKHLWDFCQISYDPKREQRCDQVTAWCITNPDKEHIYKIELKHKSFKDDKSRTNQYSWLENCTKSLQEGETMNCVVAGSYSLWTLEKMFRGNPNWKPNDIDMFIMNRAKNARHSPSDGLLDIVHTKDKTPEEVISNFDLPCCRVAFDMNYTFYVSIHAIYSLISKKIKLPRYLKEKKTFKEVLKKYDLDNEIRSKSMIETYHNMLVTRMIERIKKYQSRGFSFQWYDTDYILPWIKQRFSYVDFSKKIQVNKPEIPYEYHEIIYELGSTVSEMEIVWCEDVQKQLHVIKLMYPLSRVEPRYRIEYTQLVKKLGTEYFI